MNIGVKDTSPEAEAVLIKGYRQMKPIERLQRVVALNRALDQLAEARIRATYGPDISDRELRLRIASLSLERQSMIDAFGWDPEEEGY